MKFKNTLVLFIVLALLGGYVYIKEFKDYSKEEARKVESTKLFHLKQDSIRSIEIANPKGRVSFQKEENEWVIVSPLKTEADQAEVKSLLSELTGAKKDKSFAVKKAELGDYGLTGNPIEVSLAAGKEGKVNAVFGDKTPVGNTVFVNQGDSLVYTTDISVKNALDKRLFDWREKRLLQFQRNQVRKIILSTPKGKYTFVRKGGIDWDIENIGRPANSGRVDDILNKIEYNRVRDFVDEEGRQLRKFGLKKPAYRVELLLGKDLAQKTLLISRKIKGNYYALDESRKPIFRIDSTTTKVLNRSLTDFRGHDFARIDRDKVNRLEIQYGDTLITVLKDSTGDWYLDEPGKPKVQKEKVFPLFSDVDYALIKTFVADDNFNPARYGLDKPRLVAGFYRDGDLLLKVMFGKVKKDEVYAMTSEYKSVYLLDKTKMNKLKIHSNDIIEKPEKKEDSAASK